MWFMLLPFVKQTSSIQRNSYVGEQKGDSLMEQFNVWLQKHLRLIMWFRYVWNKFKSSLLKLTLLRKEAVYAADFES